MIRWLLRKFGYFRIDYGFSCGRHWMSIDGKVIAQTAGDHVYLRDEDVHRLVYTAIDGGRYWSRPDAYMPFMEFGPNGAAMQANPKYHAERLMYVARLRRAEHPMDQTCNWLDDAVHFLEGKADSRIPASTRASGTNRG